MDNQYFRPKTRGDLRTALREGVSCEVIGYAAEMTATVLSGWMNFENFTVQLSSNDGWVVFVPANERYDVWPFTKT